MIWHFKDHLYVNINLFQNSIIQWRFMKYTIPKYIDISLRIAPEEPNVLLNYKDVN
jgi:hypothetical protein